MQILGNAANDSAETRPAGQDSISTDLADVRTNVVALAAGVSKMSLAGTRGDLAWPTSVVEIRDLQNTSTRVCLSSQIMCHLWHTGNIDMTVHLPLMMRANSRYLSVHFTRPKLAQTCMTLQSAVTSMQLTFLLRGDGVRSDWACERCCKETVE